LRLSATTKFALTCTGAGGSATQSATVTVTAAPPSVSFERESKQASRSGSFVDPDVGVDERHRVHGVGRLVRKLSPPAALKRRARIELRRRRTH
jgi:hypothetical protein